MHHMVAIFYFTRLVSTNLLKSSQIGVWKRFLFRFPFMHSFCNLPAHTTRELWLCTLFCGYTLYNQNRVMSKAAGAIDTTLQKMPCIEWYQCFCHAFGCPGLEKSCGSTSFHLHFSSFSTIFDTSLWIVEVEVGLRTKQISSRWASTSYEWS